MADPGPSVNTLFCDRLKREGRYKDFMARVKAYMAEHSLRWGQALRPVMIEFGFESPKKEKALAAQWEAECTTYGVDLKIRKHITKLDEGIRLDNIEDIISRLPSCANPSVEMDWIRSHPAMCRRKLNPQADQIKIMPEDLLHAPGGKCPSAAAALMLINYADAPAEFFKQVLTEHKKKTEGGEASQTVEGPADWAELEKQLEEINGRVG
jgi:hypothetical protein